MDNELFSPHLDPKFKERILDLSVNGIYVYDFIKGANIYINKEYTTLTGYSFNDIAGMSQEDFFSLFHPDDQEMIHQHMKEVLNLRLGEISEIEYRFKKSDGKWMWCLSRDAIFAVNKEGTNTQFMGTFIDITDRKQAEILLERWNEELEVLVQERTTRLENSLKVQKLLMQEVHHRVKNNLQLLSSIFSLKISRENNQQTIAALEECNNKIHSLGLIYQTLYQREDLSEIDLSNYLTNLFSHLENSMKGNRSISMVLNLAPLKTSIDNAITLGLIANELITNCYKHAFPANYQGTIWIDLHPNNQNFTLTIKDNGIGMPDGFDTQKSNTFGLDMVQTLTEQMKGDIQIVDSNGGLKYILIFS